MDFTVEISELLIKPLTVTSVLKLLELVVVPLCAFVWLMSELLTEPLAVVSPINKPIVAVAEARVFPWLSSTPVRVIVIYCALHAPVTPVMFTIYRWASLLSVMLLLTDPQLVLALTTDIRGFVKVSTIE